jgi:hypothetical protein
MTRVLFWNIQKFGVNKINDPSFFYSAGHGGLTDNAASLVRRTVVSNVLMAANPDILVVLEASSGDSTPNMLASNSGGMAGLITMLGLLRAAAPAWGWRLVPPLRVGIGGRSETVGVFYRGALPGGDQLYFTGPNGWVGGWAGASTAPGLGVFFNNYPAAGLFTPDLSTMLTPPGTLPRVVPAGAGHNGNGLMLESTLAARVNFLPSAAYPYPLTPAGFVDYGPFRQPYMTTFTRTNAAGAVLSDLAIFSVHPSPQDGLPAQFLAYLTYLQDVVAARGLVETRVIGGDFNLELLDPLTGANAPVYNIMNNPPNYAYLPLLSSPGAPGGAALDAFKGYFGTHIRENNSLDEASLFLWSTAMVNSPYPGYGYIGSDFVVNFESVDNILVWPRVGGAAYGTTTMNTLTGVPFTQVVPTPGGAPAGGPLPANLASGMTNPFNWLAGVGGAAIPPAPNAPNGTTIGIRNNLTSWANYGHLKNTSDHFAIVADI